MIKDSILKRLAAKLSKSEGTQSEREAEFPVELLEEHFDTINAASRHISDHWNNHSSSP